MAKLRERSIIGEAMSPPTWTGALATADSLKKIGVPSESHKELPGLILAYYHVFVKKWLVYDAVAGCRMCGSPSVPNRIDDV